MIIEQPLTYSQGNVQKAREQDEVGELRRCEGSHNGRPPVWQTLCEGWNINKL